MEILTDVLGKVRYRGMLRRCRQVQYQEMVSGYGQYYISTVLKMHLIFSRWGRREMASPCKKQTRRNLSICYTYWSG
jgi:hypothetical protein